MAANSVFAKDEVKGSAALANTVILIIRHAEKPDAGSGLSAAGQERARAYVGYFKNFQIDGHASPPDCLFATADSRESSRPRLTLEPTSHALGLPIDSRFKDKNYQKLADELRARPHGKVILIAWHHGEIPNLIEALGVDPGKVIPNDKWPGDVFGWLIELRYDADGRLFDAKRINENLMPDDSNKHSIEQ